MTGISHLKTLLSSMNPELKREEYVFCAVSAQRLSKLKSNAVLIFQEKEGITVVLEKHIAEKHALKFEAVWALITLNVQSDLAAVGFLATLLPVIAKAGISVNVVSAYYHDHLFVPVSRGKEALKILQTRTERSAVRKNKNICKANTS